MPASAGALLDLDTKRQGRIRGIGWDAVHLAIDDFSRMSCARILDDEKGACCTQYLREAFGDHASLGVKIDRVMTDNGGGYASKAFTAR